MLVPNRRAFLGLATNAIAVATIGTVGARLISVANAMPLNPEPGRATRPSVVPAQWGPPPGPGWGGPRWGAPRPRPGWRVPPRRRRWVCWWQRGRRRCGWRWR